MRLAVGVPAWPRYVPRLATSREPDYMKGTGSTMALVKFRYVTRDRDRHGNLRFYFRRPGKPKIRLRGLPGSDEFADVYKAALAENGASVE